MINQTSCWFDQTSIAWRPDPEVNEVFLRALENQQNHILRYKGHLLLNDVYEALGLEATAPGSVLGWSQQVNNDTHVEFDFMVVEEGRIAIDFNVDGVVFHEIGRKP